MLWYDDAVHKLIGYSDVSISPCPGETTTPL